MIEIKRRDDATLPTEYGCKFWRLQPWGVSGGSDRGTALAVIAPGTTTTPHAHAEEEMFFVVRGRGHVRVGDERVAIGAGDVLRVSPGRDHVIENPSDEVLEVLCSWYPAEGR
ncbi:MAG TPA: cupin domain-containing protein [Polyangiaceae bacterium]|nr:cupin domain-containing protein [Polyangiaceae bacterium]